MTKNRARKRAARSIAATKNIRYPEAFAVADDKAAPRERQRPLEYTPSSDPRDPELVRAAAELLSGPHVLLEHGVVGSRDPFYKVLHSHERLRTDEAGASQSNNELAASAMINAPKIITGPPGTGRTARGWARVHAADAELDALGVPKAAQEFARYPDGLFLINGSTGSGKTATALRLMHRAIVEYPRQAFAVVRPDEKEAATQLGANVVTVDHQWTATEAIQLAVRSGADLLLIDVDVDPQGMAAAVDAALRGVQVFMTTAGRGRDALGQLDADLQHAHGRRGMPPHASSAIRGIVELHHVAPAWGSMDAPSVRHLVWAHDRDAEVPELTIVHPLGGAARRGL